MARGCQQSQTKGRRGRSKSKGRVAAKDECVFCHEKGHWKKDCPKPVSYTHLTLPTNREV